MSSKNKPPLIEGGGTFIDYRDPKKVFKTTDIAEWDKHLKETKATVTGTAPCAICNKIVTFTTMSYGNKPLCDSCIKEATKK